MKRGGLRRKWSMMITTYLTSISCVYKEKIKKRIIPKSVTFLQIQKVVIIDSDRKKINLIPNKASRYYSL